MLPNQFALSENVSTISQNRMDTNAFYHYYLYTTITNIVKHFLFQITIADLDLKIHELKMKLKQKQLKQEFL